MIIHNPFISTKLLSLFIVILIMIVPACNSNHTGIPDHPSLKAVFDDTFMIGTALNHSQIYGTDARGLELVVHHFNSITPENVTKWELIHPRSGEYDFDAADRFVEFGEKHDMFMVGHTLVWHSQTPRWVFEDDNGDPINRDGLLERMRDHIHTVVGRYKGRIQSWDVVNEALNEDGSLRESPWYRIIGQDYLLKAFEYAREADPDAELYYNDYSLEVPEKRDGAIQLVRYLQEHGAPITGIGTQGHYMLDWPDLDEIEKTITEFAALGIDVMVTELEIDVLPAAFEYQGADISRRADLEDRLNPYVDGLPEEVERELEQRYRDIFEVFVKHSDVMSRVTFWGVTDGDSWKNNWPVRGRTNYPLLFDREWQPKPAFYSIMEIAEGIRQN
jgi:endo-1,4-beta-xylanase